jgi:hypothetical protein
MILNFSQGNKPLFLHYVQIVEALNEPVDDSGSEGAKLFVNIGNVFCAKFFCKLSLFLGNFYTLLQE